MVSASHNSAEWNGFKIVREKSVPVSGDTGIYELYEMVAANAFGAAGVGADGSGGEKIGSVTEKTDVLTTQIQEDLKMVKDYLIKSGIKEEEITINQVDITTLYKKTPRYAENAPLSSPRCRTPESPL